MKLRPDEISLLRAAMKWHRDQRGTFFQWRPGRGFGALSEWKRWAPTDLRGKRVLLNVTWEYREDPKRLLVCEDYSRTEFRELPVTTVTEAIDVLVALTYLPVRFSSAYRAGWDARGDLVRNEGDPDRERGLDGADKQRPVVDPAW